MSKIKIICAECKKYFLGWECQKRKYCSNECRLKVLHRETPNKRRTGKFDVCEYCKENFYVAKWRTKSNRGKYCSQECYWNDKKIKSLGEGNSQYIDGRTKEYSKAFYLSIEWRNLRKEIYERDNWECQKCGKHGGRLHAHHKIRVGECKDPCLLYTSDAADDLTRVDLGGR